MYTQVYRKQLQDRNWRIEIQRTIRDKFEEGKSRYIFDMY